MRRSLTRRELAAVAATAAFGRRDTSASAGAVRVGVTPVGATRVEPDEARRAVAAAISAATGDDAIRSLARLLSPGDTVGIKLSCLAGRPLSPRPEIVAALVELVAAGGVARDKIIVFERSSRELERAGFEVRRRGGPFLCYGVDGDWDRQVTVSGEIGSCYARLVSTTCTALISVAVVKDHDLAGISGALKNFYGVIHNPNKYHDDGCDPYVADVVRHPFVASKLRLSLLDVGIAQCHGGPAFRADTCFELGRIAASTDPVGLDVWAWRAIEAERARRGLESLQEAGRAPRHLATAAARGLGTVEPETVEKETA